MVSQNLNFRIENLQQYPIREIPRSRGFRHHSQILFISSKQLNKTHETETDCSAPKNSGGTCAMPCSDIKPPNSLANNNIVNDCDIFQNHHVTCDVITSKTKQPAGLFCNKKFQKIILVEQVSSRAETSCDELQIK